MLDVRHLCANLSHRRVRLDRGTGSYTARQEECHTCYLCEAHCPSDALFVGPLRTRRAVTREEVLQLNVLGNFRRALGFDQHEPGSYAYGEPLITVDGPEAAVPQRRETSGPNAAIYAAPAVAARSGLVDISKREPIKQEVLF